MFLCCVHVSVGEYAWLAQPEQSIVTFFDQAILCPLETSFPYVWVCSYGAYAVSWLPYKNGKDQLGMGSNSISKYRGLKDLNGNLWNRYPGG
jgi:hypothetical protein